MNLNVFYENNFMHLGSFWRIQKIPLLNSPKFVLVYRFLECDQVVIIYIPSDIYFKKLRHQLTI